MINVHYVVVTKASVTEEVDCLVEIPVRAHQWVQKNSGECLLRSNLYMDLGSDLVTTSGGIQLYMRGPSTLNCSRSWTINW